MSAATQNMILTEDDLVRPAPILRQELVFRAQQFAGTPCYVVEDPASGRFFRVGTKEYAFLSRLDRHWSMGAALNEAQRMNPDVHLSVEEARAICQWVARMGLGRDKSPANMPAEQMSAQQISSLPQSMQRRGGRVSPLSVQIPLVHPDRFFQRLTPWFSWIFSLYILPVWLVTIGWAACELIVHHHRLAGASARVLAPGNWIWLAAAWILLKMIHECGHAIACKRFGGEVREAGIIFILLAPLAYIDVTSSWRFRSKWERIVVAAAGMYVELFLAAVAAIVWVRLAPGAWSQICMNVMLTASAMTVVFNANPLMRFDGYYIVSDFIEIPNLYTTGQTYVQYLVRRYLFGVPSSSPSGVGARGVFVRLYGVVCCWWRLVVFWGLVLTAATLLDGMGILISGIAVLVWIGSWVRRTVRFAQQDIIGWSNWGRATAVTGVMGGAIVIALTYLPWPGSVTAPAIVQYANESVVRTRCDGFVRRVHVHSDMYVEKGQLLCELTNDDLSRELAHLKSQISQTKVQRRIHQRHGELAEAQAALVRVQTLEKEYAEKQQEYAGLTVRAPSAGQIVSRNLAALEGQYLMAGTRVVVIGVESQKEVRLSIAQSDVADFRQQAELQMRLYFPNIKVMAAKTWKIEPRASLIPNDLALCASYGGPLAVRNVEAINQTAEAGRCEYLSPRFNGTVSLDSDQSQLVRAGQRSQVAIRSNHTVGQRLLQLVSEWVDKRLHRHSHRIAAANSLAEPLSH